MKRSMHWLTDEGIPKSLAAWLRDRGDDVLHVAASDLRGSDDDVLWRVAAAEQRIILTRDKGFIPAKAAVLPAGVVLIRVPDRCLAEAIRRLVQEGLTSVPPDSLLGTLTVIRAGRVRQRKLTSVVRHEGSL